MRYIYILTNSPMVTIWYIYIFNSWYINQLWGHRFMVGFHLSNLSRSFWETIFKKFNIWCFCLIIIPATPRNPTIPYVKRTSKNSTSPRTVEFFPVSPWITRCASLAWPSCRRRDRCGASRLPFARCLENSWWCLMMFEPCSCCGSTITFRWFMIRFYFGRCGFIYSCIFGGYHFKDGLTISFWCVSVRWFCFSCYIPCGLTFCGSTWLRSFCN